jgi:hypothetical protein
LSSIAAENAQYVGAKSVRKKVCQKVKKGVDKRFSACYIKQAVADM